MRKITADTSFLEVAAIVSETLVDAGISAVLSGGGAVVHYSDGRYMSNDLDFVTTERNARIAPVVAKLGFHMQGKDFVHAESAYFLEFPAGPLSFGNSYVETSEAATLETEFGLLQIITPTQCMMDRIAWLVHGRDPQARAQAVLVAQHQTIDWRALQRWALGDEVAMSIIADIREEANLARDKGTPL